MGRHKVVVPEDKIQGVIRDIQSEGITIGEACIRWGISKGILTSNPDIRIRIRNARFKTPEFSPLAPKVSDSQAREKVSNVIKPKNKSDRAILRYSLTELLWQMRNDGTFEHECEKVFTHLIGINVITNEERMMLVRALNTMFEVMKRL